MITRDEYKKMQHIAHGMVANEKRKGNLQPVSDFSCVDCGRDAENYDHRDYSKPLDVVPVCVSCNHHRGSALPEYIHPVKEYVGIKTEQVMTRITKTMRNKLEELSDKYHMTPSRYICYLIEEEYE